MKIDTNLDDILGEFEDLLDNVDQVVSRQVAKTAYKIEREAKQRCPVDTGRLRGSITTNIKDTEAEVGSNVEYAKFVELGTSYQAAQPFLIPAFENNIDGLEDRIVGDLLDD